MILWEDTVFSKKNFGVAYYKYENAGILVDEDIPIHTIMLNLLFNGQVEEIELKCESEEEAKTKLKVLSVLLG